jgi:hypothetical protein
MYLKIIERRYKQLLDENKWVLEIERGSTRSHPVENSRWKRLWTFRKTDYEMVESKLKKTAFQGNYSV